MLFFCPKKTGRLVWCWSFTRTALNTFLAKSKSIAVERLAFGRSASCHMGCAKSGGGRLTGDIWTERCLGRPMVFRMYTGCVLLDYRPGASRLRIHHPADDALPGVILLFGQGPFGGQPGLLLVRHNCRRNVIQYNVQSILYG